MNKPEHIEEVKKAAVKDRKTYRPWAASETALQKAIAKFIEVMKRSKA